LTGVAGGFELVHTLMQHELIDEYQPMVHPVVLGGGTRLFREGSDKTVLKRVETPSFSSGFVVLSYQKA
jgi:dihydrofolate reductase